jgi:type I thyroxine 5'-deiodinase
MKRRAYIAGACVPKLGITFPSVLDEFGNSTDRAYTGWPDRIYLIDAQGRRTKPAGSLWLKPDLLSARGSLPLAPTIDAQNWGPAEAPLASPTRWPRDSSAVPLLPLGLVLSPRLCWTSSCIFRCIFRLPPGILDFTLHLLGGTLHLRVLVAGPFSDLALARPDVLDLAFHSVLIHDDSSTMHD